MTIIKNVLFPSGAEIISSSSSVFLNCQFSPLTKVVFNSGATFKDCEFFDCEIHAEPEIKNLTLHPNKWEGRARKWFEAFIAPHVFLTVRPYGDTGGRDE